MANAEMLDQARHGLVVVFHTSRCHYLNTHRKQGQSGTNHCADTARTMGSFRVYDVIGRF